jgi:hypothetical protein
MKMEIHPDADLLPELSDAEYAELRDNIKERGLREPTFLSAPDLPAEPPGGTSLPRELWCAVRTRDGSRCCASLPSQRGLMKHSFGSCLQITSILA